MAPKKDTPPAPAAPLSLVELLVEDLRLVLVQRGMPPSDAEKIAKELDYDVEKIKKKTDDIFFNKPVPTGDEPPTEKQLIGKFAAE